MQLHLFPDDSPPCQRHSETSREAAEAIEGRAVPLKEKVRDYIVRCGQSGATDEEIQEALEMQANTQRPRRVDLVAEGVVVDSGQRRLTRSKRRAVVWVGSRWAPEISF